MFSWWKELWHTATLEQATLIAGLITFGGGLLAFLGVVGTILATARHARRALAEDRKRETDRIKREALLEAAAVVTELREEIEIADVTLMGPSVGRRNGDALEGLTAALTKLEVPAMKMAMFEFPEVSRRMYDLAARVRDWLFNRDGRSTSGLLTHADAALGEIKGCFDAHI